MNESDIPEYGAVFTFGKSRFADNIPSHFFIRNDPIVEVSCGDQHTAVVCKNGRAFTFGSNEWGQLGLGHKDPVNKPSCVKSLKPEKIVHIACGRVHTIFSTETGKVYGCGCNTDGQLGIGDNETLDYVALPMYVTELDNEIIQLSAGSQHSALLTREGTVYVWGSNSDGQLGLLNYKSDVCMGPIKLEFQQSITAISCGYYHTGFISDDGKLYLCGYSENGQTGVSDANQQVYTPTQAQIPKNILSVSCGGRHTIAITDDGQCFVCGDNSSGQLGLRNISYSSDFLQLPSFKDKIVKAVSAGECHTMLLTNEGDLYACGDTRYGKLCIVDENQKNSITEPIKVFFAFAAYRIERVISGGCHTMVLAYPNNSARLTANKRKSVDDNQDVQNSFQTSITPTEEISKVEWTIHYRTKIIEAIPEETSKIINDDNPNESINNNPFEEEEVDVTEVKTSPNFDKDVNGIPKIEKISNEVTLQEVEEKNDVNETKIHPVKNNYVNGNTGKFKKFLQHIGLKKVIELNSSNGHIKQDEPKHENGETKNQTDPSKVTSRVCNVL